ncbi:MAG: hypothetical protein AAGA70_17880 [Pseudomonadota bacterium]
MAVSKDIVATWRRPRRVMRRLLEIGRREDLALVFLMLACLLIFVAQMPRLRVEALANAEVGFYDLLAGSLFAWLCGAPLLAYAIAAISHLIARIFGGRGTWYSARLAFFWTLLATTPAWLFYGLMAGLAPGGGELVAGILLTAGLVVIWALTLYEAERAPEGPQP